MDFYKFEKKVYQNVVDAQEGRITLGEYSDKAHDIYIEVASYGATEFAKYLIDKMDEGFVTHSSDVVDIVAQWREEQSK